MLGPYGKLFFLPCFMARALRAWTIKGREKNSVHNLPYRPRTRLIRGMSVSVCIHVCLSVCLYVRMYE